jgi:hypothetical protein
MDIFVSFVEQAVKINDGKGTEDTRKQRKRG